MAVRSETWSLGLADRPEIHAVPGARAVSAVGCPVEEHRAATETLQNSTGTVFGSFSLDRTTSHAIGFDGGRAKSDGTVLRGLGTEAARGGGNDDDDDDDDVPEVMMSISPSTSSKCANASFSFSSLIKRFP